MRPRDLAYCGSFGAAALPLPPLFHVLHLGHVFLPMFLPLVTLAFLVPPGPAVLTGAVVPLLSGALTGMPPFWPPVGPFLAVELGMTCGLIALARKRWPRATQWAILVPALAVGRATYLGEVFGFARLVDLPAEFLAGVSFVAGWPGMLLILAVVPPVVQVIESRRGRSGSKE